MKLKMTNKKFNIIQINIFQFSTENTPRITSIDFDYNDGWNADFIIFYDEEYTRSATAINIGQDKLRKLGKKWNKIYQENGIEQLINFLNANNMSNIKILDKINKIEYFTN